MAQTEKHLKSREAVKSDDSPGTRWGGWIATGLVALTMTLSGVMYVVGPSSVVDVFRHLGYPDYFRTLLGVAKLLGIAALLFAPWPTIREWAYAGFAFDLIAAVFSHLLSGDGPAAISPLVTLVVLLASYLLWHRPRLRRIAAGTRLCPMM